MKIFLCIMILVTYIGVSLGSAMNESLTYDEPVHMQVGLDAWNKKIFIADPYSPPFIGEIAALPTLIGLDKQVKSTAPNMRILPSRIVIIVLSIVLLVSMYIVVKKTIGEPEALASAFLFVWEPSLLAHNHYVTKDMGFTLYFFLCYVSFLYLLRHYCLQRLVFFSLCLGLMIASKTSAVPFLLMSVIVLCVCDRSNIALCIRIWKPLCVALFLSFFVVWGSYFFQTDVLLAKRDDPERISSKLMEQARQTNNLVLSKTLQFAQEVKVPLGTYIASQKNALLLQRDKSPVVFFGSMYPNTHWYFFLINLFLKLPIPLIIFFGYAVYLVIRKKLSYQKIVPYLAPCIGILLFLCLTNVKPYVRYALPIYPFLICIAGIGLTHMVKNNKIIIILLLCLWYTISTLLFFPHFISYANVFAGPKQTHWEKLIDSNLDWGQSLPDIAGYVKKHAIKTLSFSYFGTDNGASYGLPSKTAYGTYKKEDICAFHDIIGPNKDGTQVTLISAANWYYCGYDKTSEFQKKNIRDVLDGSFLIFPYSQ